MKRLERTESLELDLRVVIRRVVVRIPATTEARSIVPQPDTGALLAVVHDATREGRTRR